MPPSTSEFRHGDAVSLTIASRTSPSDRRSLEAARARLPLLGERGQAANESARAHSNGVRRGPRMPARPPRRRYPERCGQGARSRCGSNQPEVSRATAPGPGDGDELPRRRRGRAAEPVGKRRQKAAGGRGGRLANVHQHETGGAVGVLDLPASKQTCPTRAPVGLRGCRRSERPERLGRHSVDFARRGDAGRQARGTSNSRRMSASILALRCS